MTQGASLQLTTLPAYQLCDALSSHSQNLPLLLPMINKSIIDHATPRPTQPQQSSARSSFRQHPTNHPLGHNPATNHNLSPSHGEFSSRIHCLRHCNHHNISNTTPRSTHFTISVFLSRDIMSTQTNFLQQCNKSAGSRYHHKCLLLIIPSPIFQI